MKITTKIGKTMGMKRRSEDSQGMGLRKNIVPVLYIFIKNNKKNEYPNS
jgi:hypothetical protein